MHEMKFLNCFVQPIWKNERNWDLDFFKFPIEIYELQLQNYKLFYKWQLQIKSIFLNIMERLLRLTGFNGVCLQNNSYNFNDPTLI